MSEYQSGDYRYCDKCGEMWVTHPGECRPPQITIIPVNGGTVRVDLSSFNVESPKSYTDSSIFNDALNKIQKLEAENTKMKEELESIRLRGIL